MGKNSPSRVLKTVFQDISNVEDVIKESKKIEKSCKKVNFDDQKEVEKIFADTKTIVDTLKDKVLKIDVYFDEKYQTWKSKLPTTSITETEINDSNNSQNTDELKDKAEKNKTVEKSTEKEADSNDSTNTVNDAGEKRAKKDKLVTKGTEKDSDSNDSPKTVDDAGEKQAKKDKLVKNSTEKDSDSNDSPKTVNDAGEEQAKEDKLVTKGTEKDSDSNDSPKTVNDASEKKAKKDKLVKKGTEKDSDSNDSPNTVNKTGEKQEQDKLNKTIEKDSDGKDSPNTVSDAGEKQVEKEKLIEEGTEKDSDSNNSPNTGNEEKVEDKPTEGAEKVSDSCNIVNDTCVEQAEKDKPVEEGTEKDSSPSIVIEQAENKSPEEDTEKEAAENIEIMEESDSSSKSRKNKSKRSKKNKSDGKRNKGEETENTEVAEHNGSESQNDVTNKCDSNSEDAAETPAEQKVFLKCVDIKKLVKPDILPQLKSPSPTRNNGFNDSILIISDSDQETEANDKQKKRDKNNKSNKKAKSETKDKNNKSNEVTVKSETNVGRNLRNRENVAQKNRFADLKLKHQTQKQKRESLVIIDSDSDSKQNKSERHKKDDKEKSKSAKKSKKELESASSDDNSKSRSRKKNKDSSRKRPRDLQDQAKDSLSDTSSGNDSDSSIVTSKKSVQKNMRIVKEKTINFSKKEKRTLDAQSDKKFTYKAYVPLPNIRCEKLKEYYLKTKELKDIKRLTNLDTLKKKRSRKNRSLERSDQGTSSDVENIKPKSKRKRKTSKSSHVSNAESSDDEPNTPSTTKEPEKEPESTKSKPTTDQLDDQGVKMMLDGINSGTDASGKESETEEDGTKKKSKKADKKSESSKKSDEKKKGKQSDESASSSDAEKKKEKSKWRKDKLLTSKISESDSEDEFEKFKKRNEKAKDDCRARLCKKKKKVVISSDSGSDSDRKKKKKNDSGDEFEPSKQKDSSSSSSSSSESEKEAKKEEEDNDTKKRRRIKTVKESSSEEEDKSTRKTIRRVIGHESLAEATKRAEREEKERKARIAERQKKYNKIFDEEKPEDATVDKVVLDFNEESKEEILVVNEDLVKKLKPHQAKGVQFMWDACFESVERTKKTEGSGCILAHCMGLGKTLQVIALVHTLLVNEELTGVKKVLVVCPVNTVLNWVAEFTKWLDDIEGPEVDVYELTTLKQYPERQYTVKQWMKHGGALVIGYDMFRNFTNPVNKRIRKSIRDTFQEGLVNPGPDLVVCDEGHLLKNEKTNLSIAMNRIRSVRRIVLTGTPMQNNLKEYYCMVQFVKQNLLGTYKEYLNRFVNPITNGQYTDSTQHDIQIMRKRSHVLHKLLDGIVQRKDYSVLAPFLPPKHEYVLFLTLSEVQIKLYQHYKDHYSQRPVDNKVRSTTFLFMDFQEFQRICTHPRVLLNKSEENKKKALLHYDSEEESEGSLKDFIDDDESEAKSTSSSSSSDSDSSKSVKSVKSKENKKKTDSKKRMTRNSAAAAGIDVEEMTLENQKTGEENEWWRQYCDGEELDNIAHSSKLYLLFQILQECELIGDKLLVFSQSLYSLTIIEYFLAQIDEATQKGDNAKACGFSGSWALGLDYFRLDGSSSCDNRAIWCKRFNSPDNPRARLFLISTKAGGLGINLVGANRVIIFDVSWNPSHDIQSIYRVYRFGQTKPCYIYRFVTYGTMEMKIYERQVTKQAISKRVIDEQQIDRHYNQTDLAELYNFDPKPEEQPIPLVPKDVLLGELLQKEKDRIYKYHEHQTLLENKEDEELDEAERKAAWEEFENEKTIRVNTNMGWIKNLPVASIQAALINIVQKDNPGWTRDQIQKVVPMIMQQLRVQVDEGQMLLFNRVVTEIRIMQAAQQQKMQEYFMRQQMQLLQRYQGQANAAQLAGLNYSNPLQAALAGQSIPTSSNEIVELND